MKEATLDELHWVEGGSNGAWKAFWKGLGIGTAAGLTALVLTVVVKTVWPGPI